MYLINVQELSQMCAEWRAAGLSVVATNGVFDLLHIGHVTYLEAARLLGDRLVVAVNSDSSVRTFKGPRRPIISEVDRAALVASLRCVDAVTIFSDRTAEAVMAALKPSIYVKGADYARADGMVDERRLPEARVVRENGGRVILQPYAQGRSTSALIAEICDRYGDK